MTSCTEWNGTSFYFSDKSVNLRLFRYFRSGITDTPYVLCWYFVSAATCQKDESRSWPASAKEVLGRICFKTNGMIFKWNLKGTRQMELCGTGVMGFTTCFFPAAMLHDQAGGEGPASGGKHRKGHCINPVEVKCPAVQSLMSQNRCFFWHDASGHCCRSCGC